MMHCGLLVGWMWMRWSVTVTFWFVLWRLGAWCFRRKLEFAYGATRCHAALVCACLRLETFAQDSEAQPNFSCGRGPSASHFLMTFLRAHQPIVFYYICFPTCFNICCYCVSFHVFVFTIFFDMFLSILSFFFGRPWTPVLFWLGKEIGCVFGRRCLNTQRCSKQCFLNFNASWVAWRLPTLLTCSGSRPVLTECNCSPR